jgi:hypothetical protein
MFILNQVGVPHCIVKDADDREEERQELDLEFRANLIHLLQHHDERLQMTISRNKEGYVQLQYAFGGNPGMFDFLCSSQFKYWRFDSDQTTCLAADDWQTSLVRQIHFTPVGDVSLYAGKGAVGGNLHVLEPAILPMLSPITDGGVFRVAFPRRIAIKNLRVNWRQLTEVLAVDDSAAISIEVVRHSLESHEIAFLAKCLGGNSKASTGRFVSRHLAVHSYSSLLTSRVGFELDIQFRGRDLNQLVQAFLRDTDPECFCERNQHLESLEVQQLRKNQEPLWKWLHLQQNLYSLDEAVSLMKPLFTFGDSLSNAKQFHPFPFVRPSTLRQQGKMVDSDIVTFAELATAEKLKLSDEDLLRSIFITGSSGSGKSETVFVILESLLLRLNQIPILIIDPVGYEYGRELGKWNPNIRDQSRRFDFVNLTGDGIRQFNPFVVPDDVTVYNYARFLGSIFEMLAPSATALGKSTINFQTLVVYAEAIGAKNKPVELAELKSKVMALKANQLNCRPEDKTSFGDKIAAVERQREAIWTDFRHGKLVDLLSTMTGKDLKAHNCTPTFGDFIQKLQDPFGIGKSNRSNETRDWLRQLAENISMSALARLFKPVDRNQNCLDFFSRNTVLELRNIVNEIERNTLFAFFVGLNHLRSSSMDPSRSLKHLGVFEELHRIAPRDTGGVGSNGESSSSHETGKLVAQLLAEQRKFGLSVCLVDQSVSKIIPDVLINCGTKIIRRCTFGPDKESLKSSLSLSDREMDSISHFSVKDGLVMTPELSQPAYAIFKQASQLKSSKEW